MNANVTRLGRALGASLLSTFSALALHVLAGGESPTLLAVVAPLLAAFAVAFQLSGRPLGRWRLAAIVAASQAALHTTFSMGAHAPAAATDHAHHGAPVLDGAVTVHATMPVAHGVAGALTYLGIRRASALLAALGRLAAMAARAFLPGPSPAPAAAHAPGPRIVPAPRAPRAVAAILLASLPSRAPPAAA
ncbi:hypothetical protein [Demequina phytophila]|uniref:hypothetical protein n=1 Tax=Demequina phytophila TaxID=1638981 RepID=UPI00078254A4|nr:hypothetical protein [Demequina phytophila]